MLEALGPDSSWKPQLSWRWALCSSGSTWKNSGQLIHNSSGVPGNVCTAAGSLALLRGRGPLPQQDVGSNQPSSTQVTLQPPGSPRGRPTASERYWSPCCSTGWGSVALGELTTCASWWCCCGEGSVGAGPIRWDNTCSDLRRPNQPVQYSHLHTCVRVMWSSALSDSALGVQLPAGLCFQGLLAKGWPGIIKPKDLFTQNPKGRRLQPRAK